MQERKIILTWEAIYDVADIADYIETEFGKERADRFQDDIQKSLQDLGLLGDAFGKTHIQYRNYVIYKKPFFPSIIFYIIKVKEIHILRVLREECDWAKMLMEHREYTYPPQ